MNIRKTIAGWLFLSLASTANALSIQDYQDSKSRSLSDVKLYIFGVGYGYEWSNTFLTQEGLGQFYCSPSAMILNADNFISILDKKIAGIKDVRNEKLHVEPLLMHALAETFPCK